MLFKSFEALFQPQSIQYANGSDGRNRMKTYAQSFAFNKIPEYQNEIEELAKKTEAKWLQKGEDDHIPLCEESLVYTTQTALVSLMGEYFKDDKIFLQFKDSYIKVWKELEYSIMNASPLDEQRQAQFDKAFDFMKSTVQEAISQRRESNLNLQGSLFVDVLIENCPDDETTFADAISFLVASIHTSGYLITWTLYFLATHKDVQDKVYKEVKRVIGDKGSVDENNFSEIVYLKQVTDETLRCAVIAPWAARFQDSDSELGGHKIPKNTPVIHALGVMLKDGKHWSFPNKFDPDRFSPENRKKMSSYDFVPFGFAGKRKCPGYRLADWTTIVFLATIVRRFEISMCENQTVTPVYGFVTSPKDEIWIKVTERK